MIQKISRDICVIKYRNLPLCEYDKAIDDDVYFYPKINSLFWLKTIDESDKKFLTENVSLIKKLNIDHLVFFGEINKPWISKFTESRKDFKKLIKAIEYFRALKIEKRFNGGVKVGIKELEKFLRNFYIITKCDGGFFDYNFIDENEKYIFYIHYSGEFKVSTLNENANIEFLKSLNCTNFYRSNRDNTSKIKNYT